MTNNFNEKQARKRANLQKKAQDLQKNRDKYVGNGKKESEKKSSKAAQQKAKNIAKHAHSQKNDAKKVNLPTTTRRGAVIRAQRMISNDINMRATQHIVNIPVNKSLFNGFD